MVLLVALASGRTFTIDWKQHISMEERLRAAYKNFFNAYCIPIFQKPFLREEAIMLSPLVVFAFNRPNMLQRTLTSLAGNLLADKSSLTIFCDGPCHEEDEPGTRAV